MNNSHTLHLDETLLAQRLKHDFPSLTRRRSNAVSKHSCVLTSVSCSSSEDGDIEDDFPTPRASELNKQLDPSTLGILSTQFDPRLIPSERALEFRNSTSTDLTYFEESDQDESDGGAWLVPIKISPSIKKTLERAGRYCNRQLSVRIPNIQAYHAIRSSAPLSTPLSPDALAALGQDYKKTAKNSSIPSLDSSGTTLEMDSNTSPSTPIELSSDDEDSEVWDCPIMLDPGAMEVLNHISPDPNEYVSSPPSDVSDTPFRPMKERGLGIEQVFENLNSRSRKETVEGVSRLSSNTVPSPRSFFESLDPNAQQVWRFSVRHVSPTTAIAEAFYDVPWRREQPSSVKVPEIPATILANHNDDPEGLYSTEIPIEYDQDYQPKLLNDGRANLDRTKMWLQTQEAWLEGKRHPEAARTNVLSLHIVEDLINEGTLDDLAGVVGTTAPNNVQQPQTAVVTESGEQLPAVDMPTELPTQSEPLLYHTFQKLLNSANPLDPFLLQKIRADALQTRRLHLPKVHLTTLRGTFTMLTASCPMSTIFSPSHLPVSPNDPVLAARREALAHAQKQRHMQEQVETSVWYLEALKYLVGGNLLPPLARKQLKQKKSCGRKPRVLVLADRPCAGFGWGVAMEHREAKVYTAVKDKTSRADWLAHRGPSNHRTAMVTSLLTLPFPDGAFDVVSARTLHMYLRKGEYERVLKEICRVLAPGGVLHFSVMDAVPTSATGTALDQLSTALAKDLVEAGYDDQPSRRFLSHLRGMGFSGIKRMRMALPLCGKGEEGLNHMAGMVGSMEWERWVFKLQEEQDKIGDELMQGVASALADARRSEAGDSAGHGAAWRMLVGCARKS